MCSNPATMRRALIGLWLLAAFGCVSGPANTLAPGHEGAPGVECFLVCAPNTVIALPAELQGATGPLRDQIDAYLHFHDREAQWLDLFDCKRLWTQAIGAAKEQGAIEKTPVFFAKALDELYDFNAIVMPSLLVQEARTTEGHASWDGVERQMRVVNAPEQVSGINREKMRYLVASGPSGDLGVTSVHVMVFSRNGERVFEGRGGIEFMSELDMSSFQRKRAIEMRLRSDLPGGLDALREGIAVAFDPYLTPPEE